MKIIFESANNAGGSVGIGKQMIDEFRKVADQFPQFTYIWKGQYRDLPTFIHPSADPKHKYVKRFRETNLSESDRIALKEHAERAGFLTACTPFDEKSVRDVVAHGYNILKVGSPSFSDWGLWYEINKFWHGPIIASCGGATEAEIDRVVEQNKGNDLTLMHCVSEYPTKIENLQLNQIEWLRGKYPNHKIGFSSHQGNDEWVITSDIDALEFHVCLEPKPNEYSLVPDEAIVVLQNLNECLEADGKKGERVPGVRPTQFMRKNFCGKMFWKP